MYLLDLLLVSHKLHPPSPFAHPATFSLNHSPEATDRLRGNKNFDRRWEEEEGRKIKSNKSQLLREEEFP